MPPTPFQHGTRSADCDFYWLHFGYHEELQDHGTSASFRDCPPELLQIPVTGPLSSPERILILMKQLQDSDKRYKEVSLNRYLCSAVLSELHAQSNHRIHKEKLKKEQLYADISDYISWHIQENLRISEIAARFGYNEKYLTTCFKKYAGITLKQHILQKKADMAKYALSETSQPVSQIAYSLGFSDAHNFSNAFKKETGLTPSEYRDSYAKRKLNQ